MERNLIPFQLQVEFHRDQCMVMFVNDHNLPSVVLSSVHMFADDIKIFRVIRT